MIPKFQRCVFYIGVIFFLVCFGRYESNLPTNICLTVGKKHNNTEKNEAFLGQQGVFSFTKVCIFLPMHSNLRSRRSAFI